MKFILVCVLLAQLGSPQELCSNPEFGTVKDTYQGRKFLFFGGIPKCLKQPPPPLRTPTQLPSPMPSPMPSIAGANISIRSDKVPKPKKGAGFGNLLIYYPTAFYFAAITGRELILTKGAASEICSIIECGIQTFQEIAPVYPELFTCKNIAKTKSVKKFELHKYISKKAGEHFPMMQTAGYQPGSDWWVYINGTADCVAKISGCAIGDVRCADQFAYQRLIRGPFKEIPQMDTAFDQRILGLRTTVKRAIQKFPHYLAPRVDIAIHMRNQFDSFEGFEHTSSKKFQKEPLRWLNSSESRSVFNLLKIQLTKEGKNIKGGLSEATIYLAGDNEIIKTALREKLERDLGLNVAVIQTKSVGHYRTKNNAGDEENLINLMIDWYFLTLANVIYTYRKNGVNMVSTFVHSAQSVSGTYQSGSRLISLAKRNGNLVPSKVSGYGNLAGHTPFVKRMREEEERKRKEAQEQIKNKTSQASH
jgi:hypothetical protein